MANDLEFRDDLQQNFKDYQDVRENEEDIVHLMNLEEIDRRENNESLPEGSKELTKAIFEIMWGLNTNEESAKFLDSIDSVFLYHTYYKDYSPRETLVSYMNSICCWTVLFKNNNSIYYDNQIVSLKELYSQYKDYCKYTLKISARKMISYKGFKSHIGKHTLIKLRNQRHNNVLLRCDTIIGLPQKTY